jgi:hypothetical protein
MNGLARRQKGPRARLSDSRRQIFDCSRLARFAVLTAARAAAKSLHDAVVPGVEYGFP